MIVVVLTIIRIAVIVMGYTIVIILKSIGDIRSIRTIIIIRSIGAVRIVRSI